ncbi:hypothetical protein [Mucilaginibacter kameinonensis]|uniref:hypothetical protein n=1 Tax=Mucilaginibacter kameinonensis TaxID=452286 RepID=UPI000EF7C861|nr:hypothetical protein [Mucilaginibacter kameinonensis]
MGKSKSKVKRKLKTGAIPSPRWALAAATPYKPVGTTPNNFLIQLPPRLYIWGNDQYGDCVTAEEAFAKACSHPEIDFPNEMAIVWASDHGVLNGAQISYVLDQMQVSGFVMDGVMFNNGGYSPVNWNDGSILRNAVTNGPVKLGVGGNQILQICENSGRRVWFATNLNKEGADNTHCISLCGYGTLSWLANQFGVPLPAGINGQALGYTFFSWCSFGIIDEISLHNITSEAWVRNPTTVIKNPRRVVLKALGDQIGSFLSHNGGKLSLMNGIDYSNGLFMMENLPDYGLVFSCASTEINEYLSHAYAKPCLQPIYQGHGELWKFHQIRPNENIFAFECSGSENGLFLSHALGQINLQNGNQGPGEWWAIEDH